MKRGGWKGTKSNRLVVLRFHNNSVALGEEEEERVRERSTRTTGGWDSGRAEEYEISLSLSPYSEMGVVVKLSR